jgi:hypothetical protein
VQAVVFRRLPLKVLGRKDQTQFLVQLPQRVEEAVGLETVAAEVGLEVQVAAGVDIQILAVQEMCQVHLLVKAIAEAPDLAKAHQHIVIMAAVAVVPIV